MEMINVGYAVDRGTRQRQGDRDRGRQGRGGGGSGGSSNRGSLVRHASAQ